MADIQHLDINGTTYDLKAVSVVDQGGGALKSWSGISSAYDLINPKDSKTLYYVTDSGEIYLGSTVLGKSGGNRNIGEIVVSTTPLTDAGLHLLDGSLISGSGSYSQFVTYIAGLVATYPSLFVTESAWQTSVTNYGVCGKFVYNSTNNTVRLPKITGFIEGASGTGTLGDLTEAGLPSIEHTHDYQHCQPLATSGSGTARYGVTSGYLTVTSATNSAVNSIYGNSNTVQPQSIKILYYIVIATSTKTDIQVDVDEIATDLNGKADVDLSNVPTSKSILTSSYVNGDAGYRVYSDKYCEQWGVATVANGHTGFQVTITKSYSTTNFMAVLSDNLGAYGTSGYSYIINDVNKFTIYHNQTVSRTVSWRTWGYIS